MSGTDGRPGGYSRTCPGTEQARDLLGDVFVTEIKRPNDFGSTPLHFAANWGQFEIVKILVEAGAWVNASNRRGATPLHAAGVKGHREIFQYLEDEGAENKPTKKGVMPFFLLQQATAEKSPEKIGPENS